MKPTTLEVLTRLGACPPALAWAADHPDPREAWGSCPRPEWLLWLAGEVHVAPAVLARVALECAKAVHGLVSEPALARGARAALDAATACLERPCPETRAAARTAAEAAWTAAEAAADARAAAADADAASARAASAAARAAWDAARSAASAADAAAADAAWAAARAASAAARAAWDADADAGALAAYANAAAAARGTNVDIPNVVRARIAWATIEPLILTTEEQAASVI